MSTPLGFMIWRDEDDFCPPGETANFSDGQPISLLHKAKKYIEESGKSLSQVEFKMLLEQNGQSVAENVFKTEDINNFWLVVDPSDSDENGSFSVAFVNIFANLPAGTHNFTLKIFGNGELFNQGDLTFKSDGTNAIYKELILKFNDISGTRQKANLQHQQEYAEQNAKEAQDREDATIFNIFIENKDSGHTKYIVSTHQTTLSETIFQVTPLQTLNLNLHRGSVFELKYFDQDSTKDNAIIISMVDKSNHKNKYNIS